MRYIHKIILGILIISLPAFCGLSGSVSLSTLLDQADAVVVATIDTSDASSDASTVSVGLTVQRVLKGSIPTLSTFRAEWPHGQSSTGVSNGIGNAAWSLPPGRTAIWFLQQAGSQWRILPLATGTVLLNELCIFVPNGELPAADGYDAATDPRKKLLLELEAAAFDPKTSDAVARLALMRMIDDGFGKDNLRSFNTALASSSQNDPRVIGIAGQVRAGQPGSIAKLVALSREKLPMTEQGILLMAVCDYRGTEPAAIPELATLAESAPVPRMQECAAHALREVHTKEALPFLRKLLDHPNEQSATMR